MKTMHLWLARYFGAILFALVLTFFLAVASGAGWGLPAIWHADERLHRVMPALADGLDTVSETIAYPTLPFYTMFAVGKVLSRLTADTVVVMAGIRIVSAVLGALVILLAALSTLTTGKSKSAALVAALLVMFSSGLVTIAHHAIVDIYLTFFVMLTAYLLLRYVADRRNFWLYLGFFTIGLAASSKYNGASLLLAATLIAIFFGRSSWSGSTRRMPLVILIGYLAAAGGFLLGTPRAAVNPSAFLNELLPFLARQRIYGGPARPLGISGQWSRMLDGLGPLLLLLFVLALIWALIQTVKTIRDSTGRGEARPDCRFYVTLLLIFLAFDLPIALSQFYPMRYMVPAYGPLAVLSAMMLDDLWRSFQFSDRRVGRQIVLLLTLVVLFLSALRFASVNLLYANDSRATAANALETTIPDGSRTEYTQYAPAISAEDRVIARYPQVVFKFEEDVRPITGWNMGEEGVEFRRPDYLLVDRKTFIEFEDAHLCRLNPVECSFFTRLGSGETNYELVQRFEYRLPFFLPHVKTDFANIEVMAYERKDTEGGATENASWQHSLNAKFGEQITLHGYDLEQTAEDEPAVTLYWSTQARLPEDYKVFVHCLNHAGQILAQDDNIPAAGSAPTETWLRDQIVVDKHIVELPENVRGSDCVLKVGLYLEETGERLKARVGTSELEDGAVSL